MQPQQQLHWGTYARGAFLVACPFRSRSCTYFPSLSLSCSRALFTSLCAHHSQRDTIQVVFLNYADMPLLHRRLLFLIKCLFCRHSLKPKGSGLARAAMGPIKRLVYRAVLEAFESAGGGEGGDGGLMEMSARKAGHAYAPPPSPSPPPTPPPPPTAAKL